MLTSGPGAKLRMCSAEYGGVPQDMPCAGCCNVQRHAAYPSHPLLAIEHHSSSDPVLKSAERLNYFGDMEHGLS